MCRQAFIAEIIPAEHFRLAELLYLATNKEGRCNYQKLYYQTNSAGTAFSYLRIFPGFKISDHTQSVKL